MNLEAVIREAYEDYTSKKTTVMQDSLYGSFRAGFFAGVVAGTSLVEVRTSVQEQLEAGT